MQYTHLTYEERSHISKMIALNMSIRDIAKELERSPSTISREIKRNSSMGKNSKVIYKFINADEKYRCRIHKQRTGKYVGTALSKYVHKHLLKTWSPEQISGRIKIDYPDDLAMRISYSTIYRWLRKGLLERASLIKLRRSKRKYRKKRNRYPGMQLLKNRCKEAYRRQRVGDWEIDTIVSSSVHCGYGLMTMCDRKTRYCRMFIIRNTKSSLQTYKAITEAAKTMPILTLTADQGVEFYCYRELEKELGLPLYFCAPHSPWQKGSVENLNSLIREFFPKGTNFNDVTQEEVMRVQNILNNRPKKCLDWLTPAESMLKHGVIT